MPSGVVTGAGGVSGRGGPTQTGGNFGSGGKVGGAGGNVKNVSGVTGSTRSPAAALAAAKALGIASQTRDVDENSFIQNSLTGLIGLDEQVDYSNPTRMQADWGFDPVALGLGALGMGVGLPLGTAYSGLKLAGVIPGDYGQRVSLGPSVFGSASPNSPVNPGQRPGSVTPSGPQLGTGFGNMGRGGGGYNRLRWATARRFG